MLSLYTLKLSVNGRISTAVWEPHNAATVKPLVPCILSVRAHISVRERPSTGEKTKVRGREEGKQACNCWHCDHNVRNGDDWCGEAEDRRKPGALACISPHAQKQHQFSQTDPWDENSAGLWGEFPFTGSGCHVTDSQWGGTVSSSNRKWLAGPREANYWHFPSTGKGGLDCPPAFIEQFPICSFYPFIFLHDTFNFIRT